MVWKLVRVSGGARVPGYSKLGFASLILPQIFDMKSLEMGLEPKDEE